MDQKKPERTAARSRWRLFAGIVFLLVTASLLWISSPQIARTYGRWLDIGRPIEQQIDYVFVLGGGANIRPLIAAYLYEADLTDRILVADPAKPPDSLPNTKMEADLIEGMLNSEGVPDSVLARLPLPEISTRGEILALRKYLTEHPDHTGALVTHNFHTRRVQLLLRGLLSDELASQVHIVSCPTDGFSPDNWWRYEAGLQTYWLETIKLTATWLGML